MDTLILSALSEKRKFNSLRHAIPTGMVSPDTSAMLQWFSAYYNAFPEREHVVVDELISLVRLRSGNAAPESVAIMLHLCEQLRRPVDEAAIRGILGQLHELDLSGRAGALISRYNAGEEINLAYELNRLSTEAVRSISQSTPDDYCDTPIGEILAEVSNDSGLKFRRIALLREHIMGLQGGASVAVGARPDKGKTSLIAEIVTDWAPQIEAVFGPGRPVLWVNNEGTAKRIIPRVYQAALKMNLDEIIALSNRGELVPAYTKAIGGCADIIRVKDMHGASIPQIEQVIEHMRPCVVVFDMLANVRLGHAANGANKADAVEQAWQEVRELAVRHDFVALSTVQISAEGGNQLYPPYSALKDSKTGIQGATDIILMMGALDNPDAQTIRGLSTPKNKFAMPGKPSHAMGQVYFDGARCTFDDGSSYGADAPAANPNPAG
jgi:hypothetical protein